MEKGNMISANPSAPPLPDKASRPLIFILSVPLPTLRAKTSAGREMAQNQFEGGVRGTGSLVSPHTSDPDL